MDVVELTKELVAIPSISNDEGRVAEHVAARLEASGWRVIRQPVPSEGARPPEAPRINVLALADASTAPDIVLTTHLDTVPPFIPPSEDARYIYGRGTCDAKGIFAAQWIAAERLRARGVRVALLGVAGEETDSMGAKLAREVLPEARWIIDGEPTDSIPAKGAKGILSMRVAAAGRAAHSAYPELGHSALHDLVHALERLLARRLPFDEAYGDTTVNVGVVSGGLAPNVFAPEARASVLVRLGTSSGPVLAEVKDALGGAVSVEILSLAEPHSIPAPRHMEGIVVRFGSDVPHLAAIGRTLLIGPGSIHVAHTSDERIEKEELRRSVDLYERIALELIDSGRTGEEG